jgi:hypothetical protein
VISLDIAEEHNLVASGELGTLPAIHIWDSQTQSNIGIIKGLHQDGVNLLKFFKKDEFLASTGRRIPSPVLIYKIKDMQLVLSTYINNLAIDLCTIKQFPF